MKEQTKDFLIGILIIGSIAVGGYYLLTKGVYNPYGYKQVKPTEPYSLDTTKWRNHKKDTISFSNDKYHSRRAHVLVSELAAKEYSEQQNFKPKIYTDVWYEEQTDHYIVNVMVAMTYNQSQLIERFLSDRSQYIVFSGPKFLRTAMDMSAAKVLKKKKLLLKEAQQFIERQKVVVDSVEYIKNN